ncbi:MAG: GNAT family N-acetyltransferase [archaeon]|nr:GNAT family N-acetyltransferase [archaeon]
MKDINATVIVDLEGSEEEMLKRFKKDVRKGINYARRNGLVVEKLTEEELEDFYEVYLDTMKRGGIPPLPLQALKEKVNLVFVCKKDEKIIAGLGIIFRKDGTPVVEILASLREYQKFYPNNFLYFYSFNWARSQGYKKFDLGGWQINARGNLKGINEFKERWGKVIYFKKDYPFIKAIGRKLIRTSSFFWWINKKIKKSIYK